jgi:hypothetical protein
MCKLFCLLLFIAAAGAQAPQSIVRDTYEGFPAFRISNGSLTLTMLVEGAAFADLALADDPERLSPLWNRIRMARELAAAGGASPAPNPPPRSADGHFVCVDGFGPASPEESAAGLPMHGEARAHTFDVQSSREGRVSIVTMTGKLPIVQEAFTRTVRMVDGENVVYVESELESLLGFDRPVNWGEHATIGSPFLESGVTVVDLSGARSRTRDYDQVQNPDGLTQRRLASGREFTWPMAPALNGGTVDARATPENPHYIDHFATLLDPSRRLEWVTALNPRRRLILGYVFKREEYPWLQTWGNYPPTQKLVRGMEFATQPYDVPRRQVINEGPLFGVPTFRWLPAKSKIRTSFLMFYARVPEGFDTVDDVRLENGQIVLENHRTSQRVTLTASRSL